MNPQIIISTVILTTLFATVFVILINFKSANKHVKHLDFRTIATQLIALTVWVAILANVFLPSRKIEPSISLVIFLIAVVVGIFLIRNIYHEIRSQEVIDRLINRLHKNNIKLKEIDQKKTEFLSIASHQLRSPLSAIQGYSSMMVEGDFGEIPDNLKDPVDKIFKSTITLNFLINDFLNVSRIEKGELEYHIEDVDIKEIMDSLKVEFSIIAKGHDLNLRFDCNDKETKKIRGDQTKTRQIIANLIDNAIKYTKKGHVVVSCYTTEGNLIISVQDTGLGIEKSKLKTLFEKFNREEEAIKMNVIGSGLGLYVAKVMTEAQGGRIWAESEGLGRGSTFFVKFPLKVKV